MSFGSRFRLWGGPPRRHSNSNKGSRPLQLQPHSSFGCRRHGCLLLVWYLLFFCVLLRILVCNYGTSSKSLQHATQLFWCRRSDSGFTLQALIALSAACGCLDYRKLPPSVVAPCSLLLLRVASSGPGLLLPHARTSTKQSANYRCTSYDIPCPLSVGHPGVGNNIFSK